MFGLLLDMSMCQSHSWQFSPHQELEYNLHESQERLTSIQETMASFKKELAALMDTQKVLQQSVASVPWWNSGHGSGQFAARSMDNCNTVYTV